jgi:phospholipid/cholesterol/gamma-HCH transport system ATP-binding protein
MSRAPSEPASDAQRLDDNMATLLTRASPVVQPAAPEAQLEDQVAEHRSESPASDKVSRMQPSGGGPRPLATDGDVEVEDLCLAFGDNVVFDTLSCRFLYDQISVIMGASGCGKSTLLRSIALLQKPDHGSIRVGKEDITGLTGKEARRYRQRIGMMFQHGALLDSMSVFDNVALPLREHTRMGPGEIADAVHEQLEAVGLKNVDALLPGELSGGMKKRVALARAMINRPEILFCDEPVSGLDPLAVRMIEALLVDVSQRTRVTMIITSHHISSTMRMAGHIVYMIGGKAVSGTPDEIQRSSDPRLRAFLDAAKPGPLAGS